MQVFALRVARAACTRSFLVQRPLLQTRNASFLKLLFARPTPSPVSVASITVQESVADSNPHSVPEQLNLWRMLEETDSKAGYGVIMSRWERMCEFDPSSPLLHSDDAFQLYLTALAKTGHLSSLIHAAHRRDQLIAQHPLTTPAPPPPSDVLSNSQVQPTTSISRSQSLAQGVIGASAISEAVNPTRSIPTQTRPTFTGLGGMGGVGGKSVGVSGNPLYVTVSEPRSATWMRLVRFILVMGLSGFFILVLLSVMLENSGLLKNIPQANEFEPSQTVVKFSDVHGVDEAKEELQEIVQFLKNPAAFTALGGRLPKGVLLTGRPGTGKTLLAKAIAGEAGVPFLFASASDFEEMYVGVGAKRVRDLFALARSKQPAIIFIDELDAVGGKRNASDRSYLRQTLNQLLVELDGFVATDGVIVVAATNYPEALDPALIRPGRFDKTVAVPLPDVRGRIQLFQHYTKSIPLATDVDPSVLARGTTGFSGADIENMVNQAAVQASKQEQKEVTLQNFEWAKDRIIMGVERRTHYITPEVKLKTAYHEAGHALTALYTEGAIPLHKVTCMTRGHSLGHTAFLPKDDMVSITRKELLARIDVALGGYIAEDLIYGSENITTGSSSDLSSATNTATEMIKYYGLSKVGLAAFRNSDPVSSQTLREIESEANRILDESHKRTQSLLKAKENELHTLAKALVEYETLSNNEVEKVLKGESIRIGVGPPTPLSTDLSTNPIKEEQTQPIP